MSKNTIIKYTLPLTGLKYSTNQIYAGIHWAKRKQIKDSVHSVARYFCRPAKPVECYPVEIGYRFVFKKSRPLDTLNCAFMAKMFEDALRAFGILKEDSPQFVAKSSIEVIKQSSAKRETEAGSDRPASIKEDEDYVEININRI